MNETFLLFLITFLIIFGNKIEKLYCKYYIKDKLLKFDKIAKKFDLNCQKEKSIKVWENKLEVDRFTIDFHRFDKNKKKIIKTKTEDFIKFLEYQLSLSYILKNHILKEIKGKEYEKIFYFKHPYLPYEKIYIGSPSNNYGYLYERKINKITKKLYVRRNNYYLSDLYPMEIINKIKKIFPIKGKEDSCFYKFNEKETKILSIHINNIYHYKVKQIKNIV